VTVVHLDLLVVEGGDWDRPETDLAIRRSLRGLGHRHRPGLAPPDQQERYGRSIGLVYLPAMEEGWVIYEGPVGRAGRARAFGGTRRHPAEALSWTRQMDLLPGGANRPLAIPLAPDRAVDVRIRRQVPDRPPEGGGDGAVDVRSHRELSSGSRGGARTVSWCARPATFFQGFCTGIGEDPKFDEQTTATDPRAATWRTH
jgi:hypothetical protein